MSVPPTSPPLHGDERDIPESDIIQAYSLDDTLGSKQPPSYETEDGGASSFFPHIPVESTPQAAPPVATGAVGGMAQPEAVPVTSEADPLTRTSHDSRRVRWGETLTQAQPNIHQPAMRSRGPTVSVKPAPTTPSGGPMSPSKGGIKRLNHPGQINLDGLRANMPTESIPLEPIHNDADPQTDAMALEGDDNERFLALSHELNQLDEADEADISDDRGMLGGDPHDRQPRGRTEVDHLMGADSHTLTSGSMSGSASDTSYDPAEELDHLDLIEGETDGMPSIPKRSRTKRRRPSYPKKKGWSKMRHLLGIEHSDADSDDAMEKGQVSSEATNTKSVPVQTSTGLRGTHGRNRPSALERKAAKLVRAHKLYSRSKVQTPDAEDLLRVRHDHLPDSEASTPDALETAQHMDARPAPSSGVLGQLLQLYEQQRLEQEATQSTTAGTPSITDSDAITGEETVINDQQPVPTVVPADHIHIPVEQQGTPGTAQQHPVVRTPGGRQYYASGRPASAVTPGGARTGGLSSVGNVGQKIVKGVAAEAGLDIDERPKAARSAAGTIGALIATTGNLIGAVSPNHAQLGPNPKRPGYTLDRYLLPEMNEKTLRRTAKIVRDAAPVPKSLRDARTPGPQTPGVHTPGVWTPGGLSSKGGSENYNPYFAAADVSEKTAAPSVVSSTKKSKIGAEMANASNRMSYLGNAGRNMFKGSFRPMPTSSSETGPDRHDYFGDAATQEQIAKREWQRKLRKRKALSKKQEIYITMHVAAILKRQEFLLKFARAMMMFGAPTHRIEAQMQQTANVLDVNCRCIYLPNLMLLSFGDDATHTTDTRFIKQGSTLDLAKLTDMHTIYWNVVHDKIGVERGTKQLDVLMRTKPYFGKMSQTIIGGFASFFITLGDVGFGGSFLDACAAFALGAFLVFCQQHITSEVYSNVFEIVFATLNSFIAMALHIAPIGGEGSRSGEGDLFCYNSIISGSIVLILPGFIVLTSALELQSKSIISGSVRLVYAIIYSVLLGIGIKFGSIPLSVVKLNEQRHNGHKFDVSQCAGHSADRWYTHTLPKWWGFLTVPFYSIMLSSRNQAKITRKEFPVMVAISCAGWVVANFAKLTDMNHSGTRASATANYLTKQIALVGAMGSFTVGVLSNLYGRFFDGRSFVVAVPGVLFQLPTGLASGNINFITYAQSSSNDTDTSSSSSSSSAQLNSTMSNYSEVTDGFSIGAQLLNVSLGMTIGLFCSTIFMHFLSGRRNRGTGMFAF
ncbi:hypothetical protein CBS9595_003252 [Malassezia furfur]|nr:hypothetical protein CBS9595_003252 [Malassezia furfur]